MPKNHEYDLISPCAINCAECSCFKAKDDPALLERLLTMGLKPDQLPCPGCRAVNGNCPHLDARCENYACAQDHDVDMCFECEDFPCEKLHPAADRANLLPHNMKMYSQCYIKRYGVQAWLANLPQIRKRYFTGKISYGKGPQLPDD